mmetsp:Transcript_76316/g.196498  ORF Transcript_76316/g.196498 Transcript_76316/m.196498 type:complete len:428 (-) Transcript_76316:204-1487(-)
MANVSDENEILAIWHALRNISLASASPDVEEKCEQEGDFFIGVAAMVVLFFLVMGLSGSVDISALRGQLRRGKGITCGLFCQFILMPFIGFTIIKALQPPQHIGLTLMILVSSPGGAYSNWWCSLFNADLALSVAMTAVSTLFCSAMLPVNLIVYVHLLFGEVVDIPWRSLMESLAVVLTAITTGIFVSTLCPKMKHVMSFLGNVSGISMILLTAYMSLKRRQENGVMEGTPPWAKEWWFYGVIAAPFAASLFASLLVSSFSCLHLTRPERMAITIEASYQNVGIASAVALSAYCGSPQEMSDAVAVPLLYGGLEALCLALFCLIAWKCGWSYAPANSYLCEVIARNYQPQGGDDPDGKVQIQPLAEGREVGGALDGSKPVDSVLVDVDPFTPVGRKQLRKGRPNQREVTKAAASGSNDITDMGMLR